MTTFPKEQVMSALRRRFSLVVDEHLLEDVSSAEEDPDEFVSELVEKLLAEVDEELSNPLKHH